MEKQIINTYDQHVAAGGDRIVIYWHPSGDSRSMSYSRWSVIHFIDGKDIVTDVNANWYNNGHKTFSAYPARIKKKEALAEAIAWANSNFGQREFVRNRVGAWVEKEVNDKFPIPKRI